MSYIEHYILDQNQQDNIAQNRRETRRLKVGLRRCYMKHYKSKKKKAEETAELQYSDCTT